MYRTCAVIMEGEVAGNRLDNAWLNILNFGCFVFEISNFAWLRFQNRGLLSF